MCVHVCVEVGGGWSGKLSTLEKKSMMERERKRQPNLAVISEVQQNIIAGGWNKNSMKQSGAESK